MEQGLVKKETLVAIGNSIRAKNGTQDTYTPAEMPSAIDAIQAGSGGSPNLLKVFDGTITELKATDLGNITLLIGGAFENDTMLERAELPDSIERINQFAFYNCPKLKYLKLPKNLNHIDSVIMNDSGNNFIVDCLAMTPPSISNPFETNQLSKIYVPGKSLDTYLNSSWGLYYKDKLDTQDEYVSHLLTRKIVSFEAPVSLIANFKNFIGDPLYTVEVDKPGIINHTERVEGNQIIIEISANGVIDACNLTLSVPDKNGYVFTSTCAINVIEKIEPGTYTIEKPSKATYGFTLNDAGYYESTNKGIGNSYAYAKVNIHNPAGMKMFIDCINYAESNYDYGLLSKINTDFSHVPAEETDTNSTYFTFKGLQSPTVRTIEYTDAIGDCYITIKYRKDGSGDANNDTLQFKIRFE